MSPIKSFAISDVGPTRQTNEDSYTLHDDAGIYVIADGMGGHEAGEYASQIGVASIEKFFNQMHKEAPPPQDSDLDMDTAALSIPLVQAIQFANQEIFNTSQEKEGCLGMGTTIVAAQIQGDDIIIAHVGDSRAYIIRDQDVRQITKDHSWVEEQIEQGIISEDEAKNHQFRNVISRALGTSPHVKVDLTHEKFQTGDVLLLCSDGLSNFVDQSDILQAINETKPNVKETCQHLIQKAKMNDADDNITVIVVLFD